MSSKNENQNYKSNIEKAKGNLDKLNAYALKEIGKYLREEVRKNTKKSVGKRYYTAKSGKRVEVRPGRLRRSIGYWYRRREKDLQIGSKAFYAQMIELGVYGRGPDSFLEKTVKENIDRIRLIAGKYFKKIEQENIDIGLLGGNPLADEISKFEG